MIQALLAIGIIVAFFVGFNIGGSSTGVAFGPAVGSRIVSKSAAAALMSVFALLGGWTVGRNVIETMGGKIVPQTEFTLVASVGVLFFVGLALLISNLFGVPASTSMTAVGAIAGLGLATNSLNWAVMGRIVSWWLIAPVIAFWVCGVIGRYLYPYLDLWFAIDTTDGPLVELDRSGPIPHPSLGEGTTVRELVGTAAVLLIGCYMAFSAGASNTANAIAPLVGSGELALEPAILLAGGAIGMGAFTIARRTLDTVGNDITDLPLLAALIVEVVAGTIITVLSWLGIPASLAVSATMCVIGLGWGRATRTVRLADAVRTSERPEMSVNALTVESDENSVAPIGEENPGNSVTTRDLFNPATTGRVIVLWILTPSISAVASFVLFEFFPIVN